VAKLLDGVQTTLQIELVNIYAWTDSTIVLYWLIDPPDDQKYLLDII